MGSGAPFFGRAAELALLSAQASAMASVAADAGERLGMMPLVRNADRRLGERDG
jgi:hypothetical protein